MGMTISESARIGSGSTGAASGIRLRRVKQPVFKGNACGKHRLMVIPRLSYNFLDPLRKRRTLPFLYALPVARRSLTATRRRTLSVSPSRSGCRRATTAAAPGTSVFERPASEGRQSFVPAGPPTTGTAPASWLARTHAERRGRQRRRRRDGTPRVIQGLTPHQ